MNTYEIIYGLSGLALGALVSRAYYKARLSSLGMAVTRALSNLRISQSSNEESSRKESFLLARDSLLELNVSLKNMNIPNADTAFNLSYDLEMKLIHKERK